MKEEKESTFDVEDLAVILEMLRKNDVTEFRLERNGEKLWLRRGGQEIRLAAAPAPAVSAAPAVNAVSTETVAPVLPTAAAPAVAPGIELHEVKSPMVGTFYRRPAVDAEAYVEVGDTVKKGDVLCIVEAMKLMNELQSDVSGKIVEVCLEDGQMVEYGEVLFRIEPIRQ